MQEVLLVRTNHYDDALDNFIRAKLMGLDREILLVCDETKLKFATPGDIARVSAEPARLGLFETTDMMWRCGDYALYAALDARPEATAFWMIEPDVRIHAADVRPLFDGVPATAAADFVTAWFTPAGPNWMWHGSMQPYTPQVYHCMVQFCRFSKRAAQHLLTKRKALGQLFRDQCLAPTAWPNDEAFIAATLVSGGYSVATLKTHAPTFSPSGTLSFTKPTSERWLAQKPYDQHIYHPVVRGSYFLERANLYLREREAGATSAEALIDEFEGAFLLQVELECGAPAAKAFRERLQLGAARRRNSAGAQPTPDP